MIFKQETIQSWFSGVGSSINNEVIQPFQNAEQVIWKYNQAIQHNSLTQQGWERLLAQSDDSLKAYLTSIKGTTATMTGYNVSLQGNITGFKKVSSAITQYNALSASGTKEQNIFANAVSVTNGKLGTYLTGLNGAKASLGGYVISLVGATVKTVALKVATIALNSAITMGASLIISGFVSAISEWIHKTENMISASEDAIEKIKSINDELKNNQKTISDTAKRYAELAQGVNQLTGENISLSNEDYEEFLTLSNQLAEMFPTLTRNYNDNGDAIVQLSGDVDTIVGSLQNLIEAQRDLANRQIVDELPTVFKGIAAKSNQYEQQLSDLESRRDALVKSLGNVQSEEFSANFMDSFSNKWIEISGDNLEVISQMRDDYMKILKEANIDFEELTPTYEIKDGIEVPVGFTIKINSSDEDVAKAKNTIDSKIQELASQYETDINKLNEEINTTNEKNKANWTSLSSSIFAWLSTDDSFKVMDDTMQATVQNIVNNLDWGSLNFSSWEDAKQYIQENILSLFNTPEGKETLEDIEVMFGIQTQFNNGNISVEQYQQKLQDFLNSIENLPPETKKSILLLFGIQTNDDGTTTSDVDTMVENVKKKLKGTEFDDKVGELSLGDLKIAADLEVGDDTIQSWDDLIERIEKVKKASDEMSVSAKSGMISAINGMSEGFEELDKIYKSISDEDPFDFKLLDDKAFKETFSGLGDAYTNFIETITSNSSDINVCRDSFNSLIDAWIKSVGILDKVDESTATLTASMLKMMGINNAEEIVTAAVARNHENTATKKWLDANASIDLSNATADEIIQLINEGTQAGYTKGALIQLVAQKIIANSTTLSTDGDIANLKALALQAGATAEAVAAVKSSAGAGRLYSNDPKRAINKLNNLINNAVNANYGSGIQVNLPSSNYVGGNVSNGSGSGGGGGKEASDNFVDFIEILLTRTKEITTKLTDAIEDAVSLTDKMNKNSSAIAQTQKEISVNQQAYAKYISLSNSVGLDEGYASQIRNGSLNIENITNKDLKKKVDEYKKWYEAAIKCQDTITSLKKEEKKLAQNRLEYIESYYDAIVKLNDAYKDVNDAHLEYLDAIGSSAVSDTVKGYYQNSYNKQYDSYNKALQQLADYQNEFNKLVRDGYIKNGSEAWYDGQQKIQEFTKQVDESATALVELEDKINEVEFTKFQQIIDGYDRRKEQLTNAQSLAESRNIHIGRGEYQKQIDVLSKSIDSTYALRGKKLKEQNLYDVGSTRYQELAKEIAELDNDIYGQLEDIEELKDKIFEAEFFNYEKEQENLEYFIGELSDFADLLNEDGFFDKSGAFTDEAYAKIALVADTMNKTKQETANATEALKKLSEMYENGLISETEYTDKQRELLDTIRDNVGATEDYKNELLDLYTTQIQKENESLKKNISLRKEALKNAKDYNDYADSLKSKTKSVNELEARINALQGVNNSAAKSELKRLQAQLEDANKELSDTKKDHEYDMISEGYDLMSDNLDKSLESIEYSISHSTDKQLEVVQSKLSQMVGSYKDAFSKISSIISNTGFVGSGSFNGTVSNVGTSSGSSSIANGATQSQSSVRPDGSATGINSSNINNGNNASIENEISKEPNTTNRLCAELKISKTSVSVQEGSQVSLTVSIRPNDAKNKTISWVSDKPSIASVTSDGKITGVKPGTTTITAWTTDGSGLHQSCKVTVTKKPEPPKPPQPVKPNQPSSVPQGNGVPDVGDRVTYVSGIYHEDSYGNGNWGNWGLGQGAYITSMNPNSPYPIHISTGNRLGSGDRGWLRLDQLRGYRNGAKRIDEDQVAWTQEYGNEFVARAKDGAILTRLGAGDTVFTNEQVKNLWEQSKYKPDVSSFVKENVYKSLGIQPSFSQNEVRQNMEINLHFDSLLQIQGNVSKDAIPGLKKEIDKMIPHISDQLGIFLKKELRK